MSYDIKQVIVVRKDLNMRKGKIASQCCHASMKVLLDRMEVEEERYDHQMDNILTVCKRTGNINRSLTILKDSYFNKWLEGSFAKIVVSCNSELELIELKNRANGLGIMNALITDSGATEFKGVPTNTCIAIGPHSSEEIDKITGHLKLL